MMVDDIGLAEPIREALLRLYDPPALTASILAAELLKRGTLRSPDGLYALLLAAIEQLRPPEGAPPQSHGWRRYRYVQLRYVECASHESIAQDLRISVRHAARVHQEALQALAALLLPSIRPAAPRPPAVARPWTETPRPEQAPSRSSSTRPDTSLESELAMVGRQPPEGAVDVAEVAASVYETVGSVAATRGVKLQIELSGNLPPVWVNRVSLRQILLNLMLYLMRTAPNPVGQYRLKLGGEQTGTTVTVTLWREGSPVDANAATGIPEDESLLTAAKHLAKLQAVEIEDVSDGQVISALRLRLPVGVTRTVLIVDDNPEVGDLFRRMLAKSWYHPVHVRTAARALNLVRENPPDVIILDVVMPSQDGWEIQAALRNDSKTANIPVVISSVLPDRELALSLGAADFLAKPVTRSALLQTLDRVFSARSVGHPSPAHG